MPRTDESDFAGGEKLPAAEDASQQIPDSNENIGGKLK